MACSDLSLQYDKLGKQDVLKILLTDNFNFYLLLYEGREESNQKLMQNESFINTITYYIGLHDYGWHCRNYSFIFGGGA